MKVLQTFALPLGYGTIIRNGAVDGARTRDLHLGKVALYQLSYYRIICVPWGGIEPPTRRFSVCCSTDLATKAKDSDPEGARTLDLQRDRLAL